MLKKLLQPETRETPLIHAEKGQSPYLISYRAVRRWYGEWEIHACNYLPAALYDRLSPSARKHFGKETYALKNPDGTTGQYRCAIEVHSRYLPRKAAFDFIARASANWPEEKTKQCPQPAKPKP